MTYHWHFRRTALTVTLLSVILILLLRSYYYNYYANLEFNDVVNNDVTINERHVSKSQIADGKGLSTKEVAQQHVVEHATVTVTERPGCSVGYMMSSPLANRSKKIIYHPDTIGEGLSSMLPFEKCEFSNCVFQYCNDTSYIPKADMVIFLHDSKHITVTQPAHIRQRQQWIVMCQESPAFPEWNKWNSAINDFDGTLTYVRDSYPAYFPYGMTVRRRERTSIPDGFNFATGKTKGGYAYVSNCLSRQYKRLDMMKELSKHVHIDIFGKCTGIDPCPKEGRDANPDQISCESRLHAQYRFNLAFENSLCKEYITEKFWKIFRSDQYFIPVVIGGLSVEEYTKVAPPNSFIHVYNFTSVEALANHLHLLMTDDAAFNKYHEWRRTYEVPNYAPSQIACDLCKAANHPQVPRTNKRLADKFNNVAANCKTFTFPAKS